MNDTTRPSGLAERFKGAAKRLAGTVTGNDTLRREGALHEQKADDLAAAAQLEAEAAQHQSEAELREREHRLQTEQAKLTSEAVVEAEHDAIAQTRREKGARIGAETARREAAIDETQRRQDENAKRAEDDARRAHVAETEFAANVEREAQRARAEADRLDAAAHAEEN